MICQHWLARNILNKDAVPCRSDSRRGAGRGVPDVSREQGLRRSRRPKFRSTIQRGGIPSIRFQSLGVQAIRTMI